MIEFEAKVLNVDPSSVEARILAAGGRFVASGLQRRYVYDIEPGDQSRWIRLRETPFGVTIAVKHIRHDGVDGTDEVEVSVDGFEAGHALLGSLGFQAKAYQENRRTSYKIAGADVEIDEWPMLPPYLEIEGRSREHVVEVAERLGFDASWLTGENTTKVYARYGIDLTKITDLRF